MSILNFKKNLISAAMILGAILFAGGTLLLFIEPSDAERNKNKVDVDWSKGKDDPARELEITWMGIGAYGTAAKDSWIERNLEKNFNIRLDARFLDWNSFKMRRPMLFASGDIPDVMWDGDPLAVRNNIRNGFVMEVPYEIILKYAPAYVDRLNKHGKEAWLYAWYDGKNYGLPTFNEGVNGPRIGCWRKDWLRNVGIDKVPETIPEMEEAFRRFRNNDPDGNGLKDTYGWSPNISHWSLAYADVFAAFDNLPFDFISRGDRVVWGGVQPECKEALAILRCWYRDELLDPDFIVDSQGNSMTTKFVNGRTGYMYPIDSWGNYDLESTGSLASNLKILCPGGEIVPGPPLRNKDGKRVGRTWGGAAHVMQFGSQLCRNPEKIIRVLKMIEAITKDEKLYVETRSGKEGEHWELVPAKGIDLLEPYKSDPVKSAKEIIGGFACSFFYPSSLDGLYHVKYLREEVKKFESDNKRSEWAIMNPLGKSDILPSASRYLKNLRDLQQQVYAKIITGELPLDYFDTFVKEWYRRGGTVLTEEANEMYKTMNKIYDTVGVKIKNEK